jgi:hypothetical protein
MKCFYQHMILNSMFTNAEFTVTKNVTISPKKLPKTGIFVHFTYYFFLIMSAEMQAG